MNHKLHFFKVIINNDKAEYLIEAKSGVKALEIFDSNPDKPFPIDSIEIQTFPRHRVLLNKDSQ